LPLFHAETSVSLDSSTLCLTQGGELYEDIFSELKQKDIPRKIMEKLNPVSSKKIWAL